MKISFVEPHLKIYGGIRRIIEISNRLTGRGHDVTIFHSDGKPCEWLECVAKVKSYNELLEERHDVIIYNDPNIVDYKLVKKANAKLKVFYVLELYEKELLKGLNFKLRLHKYKRTRVLRKSLKSPYLKLSNATWEKQWLQRNMGIDSELVIGGVNFRMFHPVNIEKKPGEIRILCSGDPRERKGTKSILEAVELAKKQEHKIVLETYYGQGFGQGKIAEKYCSADIFVEASWSAGWNNPVAEAMACKVPVICTDIGGVKDFAFNEKTALLVPVESPQEMAAAIVRLAKDPSLRERLRENAYQQIKQFDWDQCVQQLERILKSRLDVADVSNSYKGSRGDILSLVPANISKVLDVGCSIGALGYAIKQKDENVEVTGIELDERTAKVAGDKLDKVIVGDIERISLSSTFGPKYFDCIIFADVLEHLKEPWDVLKNTVQCLSNDGLIITSIPNINHYTTILQLVFKGYWPYRKRGIHDKTHLRFFTLKNIKELLDYAGLEMVYVKKNCRIIESPHHRINKFAKFFALPFIGRFLTFQYIICAKKRK